MQCLGGNALTQPEESLLLAVYWRNASRAHGRVVNIGTEVSDYLWRCTVEPQFQAQQALAAYDPDSGDEVEGPFLGSVADILDSQLLGEIRIGSELQLIGQSDLHKRTLHCYSVTIHTSKGPMVFIRKTSPVKLATQGMVSRLMVDRLAEVSEPIFAFDNRFDVLLDGDRVVILNRRNFEALFKDIDAIRERIPTWVDSIADSLPMGLESRAMLISALERDQFTRRKFHAASQKPYMKTMTIATVEEALVRHHLDPNSYIKNGELALDTNNVKRVVQLINEDLFKGDFSGDEFATGSKSPL